MTCDGRIRTASGLLASTRLRRVRPPVRCYAGIGIFIPVKQPAGGQELDKYSRTPNAIQRSLRCLGECGFALLTGRWRTRSTSPPAPAKIGDIARAALVLTHFEHGYIM